MRGEHKVGEKRLTWVAGERDRDGLDEVSRKILAGGRKNIRSNTTSSANAMKYAGGFEDSATGQSGTSIFDPVICELAYRWFCPPDGLVLDPFAGGSVRGIVASKLGRQYVGIELRPEQIKANKEQADTICGDPVPVWLEGDSIDIERIAKDVQADFIFSCPPYVDLERYSDDPRDLSTMKYEKFREVYGRIIASSLAMLKKDRFACFVVGDIRDKQGLYRAFPWHTIEAFGIAGAKLFNEAVLVTAVGSLPIRVGKQFANGRKLGKTHQNVLVFCKGNPNTAAKAVGPVEFGDIPDADGIAEDNEDEFSE